MVEFMEYWREWFKAKDLKSLHNQRRDIAMQFLREWKATEPRTEEVLPSPADFCAMPIVKSICERSSEIDESIDDEIEDDDNTLIRLEKLVKFNKMIPRWRKDSVIGPIEDRLPFRDSSLLATYGKALYPKLATTIFRCAAPRWLHVSVPGTDSDGQKAEEWDGMWWPQYVHHGCNSLAGLEGAEETNRSRQLDCEDYRHLVVRKTWSAAHLVFDYSASTIAEYLVEACGLVHETTTAEEMDKLNPRLVCLKCSYGRPADGERVMAVRTWRSSVSRSHSVCHRYLTRVVNRCTTLW